MTYVALIVLALVMLCVSLIARDRVLLNRTDADVVRMQSEKMPERLIEEPTETFSFADKSINQAIHANFQRVAMSLQPQVNSCLRKWPNHPEKTLIYLETDAAGRLTNLRVQEAPDAVNQCLLLTFAIGQFTRRASGIAEMNLTHGRSRNAGEYH